MFQPVSSKVRFPELEERILRFWKEHDIFHKTIEERPQDRLYVFYEGPPTANAQPGVHHVLSRAFKDLFPRYKTMRGYRVPRKAGWDTHGLPVELEVERELGLKSKPDIERFGVEEFNCRCRDSVMRYVREWESLTDRIAFWLDMPNAYITYENSYIESGWWIIKQLWDKGLVYLDYRSAPHCPRCGTSLSDAEVALGYKEDTRDFSLFVKFRLTDQSRNLLLNKLGVGLRDMPVYLVAWTTTPWTLPGNTALAVNSDMDYLMYEQQGELLIVASRSLTDVLDPDVVDRMKDATSEERIAIIVEQTRRSAGQAKLVRDDFPGRELVGLHYEPLFDTPSWGVLPLWFDPQQNGRLLPVESGQQVEQAYSVVAGEFVTAAGTSIVHIAPAFGGEDFQAGKEQGLLFLQPVDLKGEMIGGPFGGKFVKDADEPIIADVTERGLLWWGKEIRHTYPFCWRCDYPLLYYAKPTWYIRTTAVKDSLIQGNGRINWYPEHIKYGRFGDWLSNNVDWAISRERYWGTPLPLWQCQECSQVTCIGSVAELRELAVDQEAAARLDDLHRPHIDAIAIRCPQDVLDEVHDKWVRCGGTARRVPEVLDAWFDSGAMPYAQWHYPFENQETFRQSFPADFICEAVDQTRGWFYSLHAESTLLQAVGAAPESICYRNVICLGHILDDQGRKMSKSLDNVVEPWPIINAHGADALRWYLYTATPPGQPRRFSAELVSESLRRFLLTLWNTYSFFVTYAIIDRFDPTAVQDRRLPGGQAGSELDRWLLSELNVLVDRVTHDLDAYNPTDAGRAIQGFVEGLSNWYVRRSRRRFWKATNDADKLAAHQTLYACLVTLAKLLAPFTPFVAEELYQNLVRSWFPEEPASVHLAEWPQADGALVDEGLMADMRLAMRVVSLGRAARSKARTKVRQPLARAVVRLRHPSEKEGLLRLASQIRDELNVKGLELADGEPELAGLAVAGDEVGYAVGLDTDITAELADEGLARELVHRIQSLRKAAGFQITDHIETYYRGPQRLRRALEKHADYVRQETLSRSLVEGEPPEGAYVETQKLEGDEVRLAVRRAEKAS